MTKADVDFMKHTIRSLHLQFYLWSKDLRLRQDNALQDLSNQYIRLPWFLINTLTAGNI